MISLREIRRYTQKRPNHPKPASVYQRIPKGIISVDPRKFLKKIYKIDATNKRLGRLATEIVTLLQGKNQVDFLPYKFSNNKVIVFNTAKMVVSGKKFEDKKYYRHSGYPGGIKVKTYKELFEKDSNEPLKKAVYGMLPKNKLRDKMIKNLKLYAQEYKE